MNSPKPFLQINGKTFIENIVDGYEKSGIKKIAIVMNHLFLQDVPDEIKERKSIQIVPNYHPDQGRFYSVQIGLKNIADQNFTFVHNIDNPFVDQKVLEGLYKNQNKDGYVVPVFDGKGGHPILLSKKVIHDFIDMKSDMITLRDALLNYCRTEVQTDSEKILVNINTWNDYEFHVLNKVPDYSYDGYI